MSINTDSPEFQAALLASDAFVDGSGQSVVDHDGMILCAITAYESAKPSPWQTMETAPAHIPILMLMKHGAIEGAKDL